MLEPYEWKRSCTVLREERGSNPSDLLDYVDLTRNLGGCFIDLMSGEYIINVLEPKTWDEQGSPDDMAAPKAFRQGSKLSQHISFLRDFFRSYKDFSDSQTDTIELMLEKLYANFGISDASDFRSMKPQDFPILSDLYSLIEAEYKSFDDSKRQLFRDRIVQRSLCDNALYPYFKDRLIYDNCACQKGKGTHFGLYRVCGFLREFYNRYGTSGWILKGDITQYFYSIDCEKLKAMLRPRVKDERLWTLLTHIIDSGSKNGRGLPLGNQTSQWFSLLYLDPLDRLVKEKLRVKWYSRYMDDFVLIHQDKAYLQECLRQITALAEDLGLTLNPKTQIFPVRNGVDYLGWHIYLTETGKVIRKIRQKSKTGMKRRLRVFQRRYAAGEMEWEDIKQHMASWRGHAAHGHTYKLREKMSNEAVFVRSAANETEEKVK